MAAFSHAIYIDESGNGAPVHGIQSFWVTAAIAVSFSNQESLDFGSKSILKRYFRPGERELKGKNMPNHLLRGASIDQIVQETADLLTVVDADVWIASAHNDKTASPCGSSQISIPKDIARRIILEKINDYLNSGVNRPNHFLIIWDISDQQELEDFSRSVATFRHNLSGKSLNPRLAPAVLGGLSHDWSGLQIADMVAHCALHHVGLGSSMPDANPKKAKSFKGYLEARCHG